MTQQIRTIINMDGKIMLVGDRPSPKNTNQSVAFYGTKSMDTLAGWLFWLGLKKNQVLFINSHTEDLLVAIEVHHNLGGTVVALGNNASDRLEKIGVKHFKLPHPSGRNRKLNDKKFIDAELKKCKNYICA